MKPYLLISRIRNYSLISFLLPLITINVCLILFKFLGAIDTYPQFNYEKNTAYTINEYLTIGSQPKKLHTFTSCPKNKYKTYISKNNQTLAIIEDNKLTQVSDTIIFEKDLSDLKLLRDENLDIYFEQGEEKDSKCIKNYKFLYLIINNFNSLEKILISAKINSFSGYSNVKNPYLYGEVSISRTARYFPATLIFKPFIILSAIFLFFYWKNNLNLFNELKKNNILNEFSKKFFHFGILSCIFLFFHATLLGIDLNSELFSKLRRLIIILFIFFEICAQFTLTRSLLRFRKELTFYINPIILKIKVIFVAVVFLATIFLFLLLALGDVSTATKHTLEWNYFSVLLVYYLLSRMLWNQKKP